MHTPYYIQRSIGTILSISISTLLLLLYIVLGGNVYHPALFSTPDRLSQLALVVARLGSMHPTLIMWLSILATTTGAIAITTVAAHRSLYPMTTRVPMLIFASLVISFVVTSQAVALSLVALICSTMATLSLLSTASNRYYSRLFEAAIYLGVLPLIYPSTFSVAAIFFVALMVIDKSLNELIIALVGLVTPLVGVSLISWIISGGDPLSIVRNLAGHITWLDGIKSIGMPPVAVIIFLSFLVLLFFVALFCINDMTLSSTSRRNLQLFQAIVVGIALSVPFCSFSIDMLIAAVAPLSLIITPALVSMPNRLTIPIYIALVGLAIYLVVTSL